MMAKARVGSKGLAGVTLRLAITLIAGLLSAVAHAQTAASPSSASEEGSPDTTLSSLVPELSSLPDTTSLHIAYHWYGLAPGSPIEVDFRLELRNGRFVGKSVQSKSGSPFGGQGGGRRVITAKQNVTVLRDVIRTFLSAVLSASAEEKRYAARVDHTDDYPTLAFELKGRAGKVIIGTASQPVMVDGVVTRAPWGILYADRTYVVSNCEIDRALEPLSKAWLKVPAPASPFVMMGGEVRPPEHC
jgi:hypothetical protein